MCEGVLSTSFSRLDLGDVLSMCQIGSCYDDPPAYAECVTKLTQQVTGGTRKLQFWVCTLLDLALVLARPSLNPEPTRT